MNRELLDWFLIGDVHDDASDFRDRLDWLPVATRMLMTFWRLLPPRHVHHADQDGRRKAAKRQAMHDVLAELIRVENSLAEGLGVVGDVLEPRRQLDRRTILYSEEVGEGLAPVQSK